MRKLCLVHLLALLFYFVPAMDSDPAEDVLHFVRGRFGPMTKSLSVGDEHKHDEYDLLIEADFVRYLS